MHWLAETASTRNCPVLGSLIIFEGGRYYNRLVWMRPDGTCDHYDKRHLFRMAGEHRHFASGDRRLVVTHRGWRFCPLVCYDLRFPVWSRNRGDYDVLIYIANWPEPRATAWRALLVARAIENQAYVVGVNRVGNDGRNVPHSGDSAVIDAKGTTIFQAAAHRETVSSVTLDYAELEDYRRKFQVLRDADRFRWE